MTLSIELTQEAEERLNRAAQQAGIKPEDFARRLIETLPLVPAVDLKRTYTARELLSLDNDERNRYLRATAERAATEYEADLALPAAERQLTAFIAVSGTDFLDGTVRG